MERGVPVVQATGTRDETIEIQSGRFPFFISAHGSPHNLQGTKRSRAVRGVTEGISTVEWAAMRDQCMERTLVMNS